MKYLTWKLRGVDLLVEASDEEIVIRSGIERTSIVITEDGKMVVNMSVIEPVVPAEPEKPKGVRRHSRKEKAEDVYVGPADILEDILVYKSSEPPPTTTFSSDEAVYEKSTSPTLSSDDVDEDL